MSDRLKSAQITVWREVLQMSVLDFVTKGLMIASIAVLTRAFTVTEVGVYFVLTPAAFLLNKPITGVAKAIKKQVTERVTNHGELFSLGVITVVVTGLLCGGVLLVLRATVLPITVSDITIGTVEVLAIIGGAVGKGSTKLATQQLEGMGEPSVGSISRTIFASGYRLGAVAALSFYTSASITTVFVVGELGGLLVMTVVPIRMWMNGSVGRVVPTRETTVDVVQFAKWSIPNGLLSDFYHRVDSILIVTLVGSAAVGFYESSVRIMTALVITSVTPRVMMAKVSGLVEEGKEFLPEFNSVLKTLFIIGIIYFIGITVFGETLLRNLYGQDYTDAYLILVALTAQLVTMIPQRMYAALLNALDRPQTVTKVVGPIVVLNIAIAIPLILQIGAVGMVVASIVTETFRSLYFHYIVYDSVGKNSRINRIIDKIAQ